MEHQDGDADIDINISSLGIKFFPNLARLDHQDICPSLKDFDVGDPSGSLDLPFLKSPEDDEPESNSHEGIGDRSGICLDDDHPAGFDDDDAFDLPPDTGFGDGGEVWARDAAVERQLPVHDGGMDQDGVGGSDGVDGAEAGAYDPESGDYVVSLEQRRNRAEGGHEDILSYFDQALRKIWAGPEHWRIRRMKDISKSASTAAKPRREKEPFEIDFLSPLDPTLAETLYTPATSSASISLPKAQWKSKSRNLLPDDKHFNSRQLLQLFLKPKARLGGRRPKAGDFASKRGINGPEGEMDEAYWARQEANGAVEGEAGDGGNYDANFFQDDGLAFPGGLPDDDDDEFADAREQFSPGIEGEAAGAGAAGIADVLAGTSQGAAFGSQLVTQNRRLRPEYVQYARVAKKVDVRRLKEEMWRGMDIAGEGDQVGFFSLSRHTSTRSW
jgi:condensin complex subunit 2